MIANSKGRHERRRASRLKHPHATERGRVGIVRFLAESSGEKARER